MPSCGVRPVERFVLPEPGKRGVCSACGVPRPVMPDGSWRWTGERWEHKCPDAHPQAGYFEEEL